MDFPHQNIMPRVTWMWARWPKIDYLATFQAYLYELCRFPPKSIPRHPKYVLRKPQMSNMMGMIREFKWYIWDRFEAMLLISVAL